MRRIHILGLGTAAAAALVGGTFVVRRFVRRFVCCAASVELVDGKFHESVSSKESRSASHSAPNIPQNDDERVEIAIGVTVWPEASPDSGVEPLENADIPLDNGDAISVCSAEDNKSNVSEGIVKKDVNEVSQESSLQTDANGIMPDQLEDQEDFCDAVLATFDSPVPARKGQVQRTVTYGDEAEFNNLVEDEEILDIEHLDDDLDGIMDEYIEYIQSPHRILPTVTEMSLQVYSPTKSLASNPDNQDSELFAPSQEWTDATYGWESSPQESVEAPYERTEALYGAVEASYGCETPWNGWEMPYYPYSVPMYEWVASQMMYGSTAGMYEFIAQQFGAIPIQEVVYILQYDEELRMHIPVPCYQYVDYAHSHSSRSWQEPMRSSVLVEELTDDEGAGTDAHTTPLPVVVEIDDDDDVNEAYGGKEEELEYGVVANDGADQHVFHFAGGTPSTYSRAEEEIQVPYCTPDPNSAPTEVQPTLSEAVTVSPIMSSSKYNKQHSSNKEHLNKVRNQRKHEENANSEKHVSIGIDFDEEQHTVAAEEVVKVYKTASHVGVREEDSRPEINEAASKNYVGHQFGPYPHMVPVQGNIPPVYPNELLGGVGTTADGATVWFDETGKPFFVYWLDYPAEDEDRYQQKHADGQYYEASYEQFEWATEPASYTPNDDILMEPAPTAHVLPTGNSQKKKNNRNGKSYGNDKGNNSNNKNRNRSKTNKNNRNRKSNNRKGNNMNA